MSTRTIAVVVLALICGASAAVGMNMLRGAPERAAKVETVPIVVAKHDAVRAMPLSADSLALLDWPKDRLPDGAFTSIDAAVQRIPRVQIVAGDYVSEAKLAPAGSGAGTATLIPRGMRAYTIQTASAAANVAGFILPQNRVDVLLTLRGQYNDETGGGSTTTLIQAVEVLAIGGEIEPPPDNKTNPDDLESVTLLVTPDQAKVLDLGQKLGQLSLSLRNPDDDAQVDAAPVTLDDLRKRGIILTTSPPEPVEQPTASAIAETKDDKPEYRTIRTVRGSHVSSIRVTVW